jgi:hypothetical protein
MTDSVVDVVLANLGVAVGGEFKHYGRKGMKWGVIRPRGADGLVVTGKAKREVSEDHITSRQQAAKKRSELSNAELKKLNERLQLEKTNNELQSRTALQKIKAGTQIAGTILAVGSTVTTAYNFVNSPAGKATIASVQKLIKDL